MTQNHSSIISLDKLSVKAHIGVTDDEQNVKQNLLIDFKFFFETPPDACESDDINDTLCYNTAALLIEKYCASEKFRLLEYLCYQLYKKLREVTKADVKIWIKVDKCNPPVNNLEGVTSFEYSDLTDI